MEVTTWLALSRSRAMTDNKTSAASTVCNRGGAPFASPTAVKASKAAGTTDGVLRLRRVATSTASPQQLEEAQLRGAASNIKRFQECTYNVLLAMLGITMASLVIGIFAFSWHHRKLGRALIFTACALEAAIWVIFLCTLAERPRALLASIFAPSLLCNDDASKTTAKRRVPPYARPPATPAKKIILPL